MSPGKRGPGTDQLSLPPCVETAGLGGRGVAIGKGRGSVVETGRVEAVLVGIVVIGTGTVVGSVVAVVVVVVGGRLVGRVVGVLMGASVVRTTVVELVMIVVGVVGGSVVGGAEGVSMGVVGTSVGWPDGMGVQVTDGVALAVLYRTTSTVRNGVGVYSPPVYASLDLVPVAVA